MPGNPARELQTIFDAWEQRNGQAYLVRVLDSEDGIQDTVRALRLLDSIDTHLDCLENQGQAVDVFRSATRDWFRDVFHYPHSWGSDVQSTSRGDMLKALAVLLDNTSPGLSHNDEANLVQTVGELLDDTIQALYDDEGLDPYLRRYLFDAINHARTCLGRYETSGLFDLARAVKDLEVLLAAAQTMSRGRSSAWEKLRERFGKFTTNPTTAAISSAIAGSVTTALITQG